MPFPEPDEPTGTLGVDLGIVNLATASDGDTFSGEQVEHTSQRYACLRHRLQKHGTRSAKRHLKKMSGREARFKRQHQSCDQQTHCPACKNNWSNCGD